MYAFSYTQVTVERTRTRGSLEIYPFMHFKFYILPLFLSLQRKLDINATQSKLQLRLVWLLHGAHGPSVACGCRGGVDLARAPAQVAFASRRHWVGLHGHITTAVDIVERCASVRSQSI